MSMLGQLDEAIAECKKAIALDPYFGNHGDQSYATGALYFGSSCKAQ